MKRHIPSTVALLVMVLFAFGSMDLMTSDSPPNRPSTGSSSSPGTDSPTTDESLDKDTDSQASPPPRRTAKLIIEDWRFTKEHGFVKAAGQVTNNSSTSLQNVTAVATFYTSDGGFVKTSEALISYNPILPGQTSPFEVMDTDNPAIAKVSVSFKFLLRGTISSVTREEYEKPTAEELEAERLAEEAAARARAEAEQARAEEQARKAAALEAAKWRIWETADGKYKVEAKFVKFASGSLTLEKKDGTTVDVPLDRLCKEDQEFVKHRKWTTIGEEN